MFFFMRRYTATVSSTVNKDVTCQSCDRSFTYPVTRKAQGFGDSWFCLDNAGAEKRALTSAERNCNKALAKAIAVMPCPHCNWYQKNMVAVGKRRRLFWTWAVGLVFSWFVTIWESGASNADTASVSKSAIAFWAFLVLGLAWFFLYNPNRGKVNR